MDSLSISSHRMTGRESILETGRLVRTKRIKSPCLPKYLSIALELKRQTPSTIATLRTNFQVLRATLRWIIFRSNRTQVWMNMCKFLNVCVCIYIYTIYICVYIYMHAANVIRELKQLLWPLTSMWQRDNPNNGGRRKTFKKSGWLRGFVVFGRLAVDFLFSNSKVRR